MIKSLGLLLISAASLLQTTYAQEDTAVYEDPESGILFNIWPQKYMTFGIALPADGLENNATEFLGLLTCTSPGGEGVGWCGMSLGGYMPNNLLLMAYPNEDEVLTSFRWATKYSPPQLYTGDAELTRVSSTINETHYSIIFRCENCLQWTQGETSGGASTSTGGALLGWAHAATSPTEGTCPDDAVLERHENNGLIDAKFNEQVASSNYESWAALANSTVPGTCG